MSSRTAALTVPILPHTSPEAEQPDGMHLPLYPHQLRALHRCLVIEHDESQQLGSNFGHQYDFKSRGGCLADEVGTGKTATSIGLILSDAQEGGGDTLVVAPAHLIPQWESEIEKMTAPNAIEVIVGKAQYEAKCSLPTRTALARIVLVDVDSILNEAKVWYDWRQVYRASDKKALRVSSSKLELYKKAALFCVKSPKGPCSYTGWVYTGSIHLPQRPWRRVIFDEIQDLVADGTESQKNLLQVSRTATHVWLLTATPFPHGNSSVYANHELLGFCRLVMDVEVDRPLPYNHPFENIKRKLYIRSPRHVADQAVTAPVTRNTVQVQQLDLEKRFYELELRQIVSDSPSLFSESYQPLRQMTVHPEASEELRQYMGSHILVSASVNDAAQRAINMARTRLRQIKATDVVAAKKALENVRKSLSLARKVKTHRAVPIASNPFSGPVRSEVLREAREKEVSIIHDHYCLCSRDASKSACYAHRHIFFRVMGEGGFPAESIRGKNSLTQVISYFQDTLSLGSNELDRYITHTQLSSDMRSKSLETLETERSELIHRIKMLSKRSCSSQIKKEIDELATAHGSKPAALVRFLKDIVDNGDQVIVFSYWHDTLKLVGASLSKCGLDSAFCSGANMVASLQSFTAGLVPILLLSAKSKASGANLQNATHVVLLDPAGASAEHGSTLEKQAIGRAARMGQEHPVTVTRFCVMDTIEETLFQEIDQAVEKGQKRTSAKYEIQDAHRTLPNREKKPRKDIDDGDEDVTIAETLTFEDRIRRNFLAATENGDVVDLLDEDSDDDENDSPEDAKCSPTETKVPSCSKRNQVKQEPGLSKKRVDTEKRVGDYSPDQKRHRSGDDINSKEHVGNSPQVTVTPHGKSDDDGKAKRQVNESKAENKANDLQSPSSNEETFSSSPEPNRAKSTAEGNTTPSAVSNVISQEDFSPQNTTVTPHETPVNDRMQEVGQFLHLLELSEYEDKFSTLGYDSLEWLCKMSDQGSVIERVAADVCFKTGHAIRFQIGLADEAKKRKKLKIGICD